MRILVLTFLILPSLAIGQYHFPMELFNSMNFVHSRIVTDIDGDGLTDIIYLQNKGLHWSRCVSAGEFALIEPYLDSPLVNAKTWCGTDFNLDGKTDFISLNSGVNGSITLLLNTGNNIYTESEMPLGDVADHTRIKSFMHANNDEYLDFVIIGLNTCYVVLNNAGNGVTLSDYFEGIIETNLVTDKDFNNDGYHDIAIFSYDNLFYLINDQAGGFSEPELVFTNEQGNLHGDLNDFNSDGYNDLMVVRFDYDQVIPTYFQFYAGTLDGFFSSSPINSIPPQQFFTSSYIQSDWNNDGVCDLIVNPINASYLETDLFTVDENFQLNFISSSIIPAGQIIELASDMNGDGFPDAHISDWIGRIQGVAFMSETGVIGHQKLNVDIATFASYLSNDFNNDGHKDIAALESKGLSIFNGSANGFNLNLYATPLLGDEINYTSEFLIDPDNDGDMDISATGVDAGTGLGQIFYFENTNGVFSVNQFDILQEEEFVLGMEDFDMDGIKDIISQDINYNKHVRRGNVNGSFGINELLDIPLGGMQYADFDLDGDPDLVIFIELMPTIIQIWENINPSSLEFTAGSAIVTEVYDPLQIFEIGHLNNDSYPDIFYYDGMTSGSVWACENVGGVINDPILIANYPDLGPIQTIDINEDGMTDILRDEGNGLSVLQNQGDLMFSPIEFYSIPGNLSLVNIFDYVGDSSLELLMRRDGHILELHDYILSTTADFYEGAVFFDQNENGLFDGNEVILPIPVNITHDDQVLIAQSAGFFPLQPSESEYVLIPDFDPALWQLITDSISYTVLNNGNPISYPLLFGLSAINESPDFALDVHTQGFNCTSGAFYLHGSALNSGNTIETGTFSITIDQTLFPVLNVFPSPDVIMGNLFTWNFLDLLPGENFQVIMELVHPGVDFIGQMFSMSCSLSTASLNETRSQQSVILCAYDPNDKEVEPTGYGIQGLIQNNTPLTYTIHFQNTGNAPAENVVVKDQLSYLLSHEEIEMVAYSHDVTTTLGEDGLLTFYFNDIHLPDSSSSQAGSQGFVTFTIDMLPDLIPGSIIHNTAEIYFDNNPAIYTGTVSHTIYTCQWLYPSVELLIANKSIYTAIPGAYQWYLNDVMIDGASSQYQAIDQPGIYECHITTPIGCEIITNSYEVLSVSNEGVNKLLLFPNPGTGIFYLNANEGTLQRSYFHIYSSMGGEIMNGLLSSDLATIDLSSFEDGIYFLVVVDEHGNEVSKAKLMKI